MPATQLTPPLKWAGGKRWFVPRFQEIWENHRHRRLVEPFAGGLGITVSVMPQTGWLNDVNPHLINFYRWVQRGLIIDIDMKNDEKLYYRHRRRFNDLISQGESDSKEAASLFYYLNRTGFNGLCRFNKQGYFNVPMGRYHQINYRRDFTEYMPAFSRWRFRCGDFAGMALAPADFVYADPPYDGEFADYSSGGFDWADQERLANWLAAHPGAVVAANRATPRILKLYGDLGFDCGTIIAPRRISSNGDRSPVQEMVAVKNV